MHVSFEGELARLRADNLIAEAQPRGNRPAQVPENVGRELGWQAPTSGNSLDPWHRDPFEAVLALVGITLLLAFALGGVPWLIAGLAGVGLGAALRARRRFRHVAGPRPAGDLSFEETDRWRAWRVVEPDPTYLGRG